MNEPSFNGIPFKRYKEFFEAYKALAPETQKAGNCNFVFDLSFILRLLDSLDAQSLELDKLKNRDNKIMELQRQLIAAEDEIRLLRRQLNDKC